MDYLTKGNRRDSQTFKFSNHDGEDISSENILVIGTAGSGKSSIVNYINQGDFNFSENVSRPDVASVTNQILSYDCPLLKNPVNPKIKKKITFFDTIGLGADDFNVDVVFNNLKSKIAYESKISKILIVLKFERYRTKMKEDLKTMIQYLKYLGATDENFFLIITFCDPWKEEIIIRNTKKLIDYYGFQGDIIKINEEKILTGCFPNANYVKPIFEQIYIDETANSVNEIKELLFLDCSTFCPMKEIIITIEKETDLKLKQLAKRLNQIEKKY